jgi:hypothetical protein
VKKPCCIRTCPAPRQVSQVSGLEPLAAPLPEHSSHSASVGIRSRGVAEHGLLEVELEFVTQVGAAEHLRAAAAATAEDVAEHVAEDVAERVARVEPAAAATAHAWATPAWPNWSYIGALLRVGEHLVGLLGLLELLLGLVIVRDCGPGAASSPGAGTPS